MFGDFRDRHGDLDDPPYTECPVDAAMRNGFGDPETHIHVSMMLLQY